jgi:hypothetical protein
MGMGTVDGRLYESLLRKGDMDIPGSLGPAHEF